MPHFLEMANLQNSILSDENFLEGFGAADRLLLKNQELSRHSAQALERFGLTRKKNQYIDTFIVKEIEVRRKSTKIK